MSEFLKQFRSLFQPFFMVLPWGRSAHFKCLSPFAEEQHQTWLAVIRELLENIPWNRISNCDKDSWPLYPNVILPRTEVGAESVQSKIVGNEKENITIVASVTAIGDKLPLRFRAISKMIRIKSNQIESADGHWRNRSQTSSQTSEISQSYRVELRRALGLGPIHLLLNW
jgi:hypothetical protein